MCFRTSVKKINCKPTFLSRARNFRQVRESFDVANIYHREPDWSPLNSLCNSFRRDYVGLACTSRDRREHVYFDKSRNKSCRE